MIGPGEDPLTSLNSGLLQLDPAHKIVDLNHALASWRGLPENELLEHDLDKLLTRGSWIYWETTIEPLLEQQGHAWDLALQLENAQGPPVEVLVNARRDKTGTRCILFPFSGRLLWERRLLAAQDQARRKQAQIERLEKIGTFRRDFINAAAHELATPMTPLRLQTHLLQQALKDHEQPELQKPLEKIRANLDRLSRITDSMLQSADVTAGRLDLQIQPVRLSHVLPRIVDTWQKKHAPSRPIELEVQDAVIPADPDALTTCLENLMDNAVKFSPPDTPIKVQTLAGPPVQIIVEDQGRGIEPDRLQELGHPFVQAHDRSQVTTPGVGLGLHIVRGLMDAQGGRFDIESEGPKQGTRAILEFPAEEGHASAGKVVTRMHERQRS